MSDFWNRAAVGLIWVNGVVLLGIFTRSGSSAFMLGLPVIYYAAARIVAPRLGRRGMWGLAGTLTLVCGLIFALAASALRANVATGAGNALASREKPARSAEVSPPGGAGASNVSRQTQASGVGSDSAGQTGGVQALLQRIERDPGDARAHYDLAVHHARPGGDSAAAVRHAELAKDAFPEGSLWHRRAAALLDQLKGASR